MMVSMSESWKEEILEGYKEISFDKHQRMYDRYKKLNRGMQDVGIQVKHLVTTEERWVR